MTRSADSHHSDFSFSVGDWVYVKLRPYRQTSLAGNNYQKLGKCYYGPYQVIERVGPIVYKLALPSSTKIHHVFHCSLLKPHKGPMASDQSLPPTALDNQPIIEPLIILYHKWDNPDPPQLRVLVQWLGLPPENSTWESWTELQASYHLEDKVILKAIGIDSNLD